MNDVFPTDPVDDYDDDGGYEPEEDEGENVGNFGDDCSPILEQYRPRIEAIVGKNVVMNVTSDYPNKHFRLSIGPRLTDFVAGWSLTDFSGCCGLLISTAATTAYGYSSKGLGTILNQMRLSIAKYWGYTTLIATDVGGNKPQRKILAKNNWKDVHSFVNRRTGNNVIVSVHDLRDVD